MVEGKEGAMIARMTEVYDGFIVLNKITVRYVTLLHTYLGVVRGVVVKYE